MRASAFPASLACGLALAGAVLLAACPGKPKLPADPGLAADDLGTGVALGMELGAAEAAAAQTREGLACLVLTRDALATAAPYAERPEGKDLVLVLHAPHLPVLGGGAEQDVVDEMRCYLAPAEQSRVTLLGNSAAALTPESAEALLGKPVNRTVDSDGKTHLAWYFEQGAKAPRLKLITSHNVDGHCFALALSVDYTLKL
jgi:hypothetical protein